MTDYAFLHGGGQGSWAWAESIAALDRQTDGGFGRALALDIPGCGAKRDRATDGIGVDDIAQDLIGDITAAGLHDVVLVGHSQAGTILPLLIAARPLLFRHVVYVACSAPASGETVLSMRSSLPRAESAWTAAEAPGSRESYRAMFCNDMPRAQADAFLDRLGPDRWPRQSYARSDWRYDHLAMRADTYVLCMRDAALHPRWQEIFAARLHTARTIGLDAGHQAMNTRPHALAEILRAL